MRAAFVAAAIAATAASALALSSSGCTGTTGYELVTFHATAVGPAGAQAGQPYTFTTDLGYTVELDVATIHVGAIYLDQSVPTSGQQQEPCTLPGTYVGQVIGSAPGTSVPGRDIDMLSSAPQPFPSDGEGSTIPAGAGQIWLTHGDVFAATDILPVLTLDGHASKDGGPSIHFEAAVTIDSSRSPAPANTALPGESPICIQRIVSPVLTNITLAQGGTLVLHLDPAPLFTNVDFSELPDPTADPALFTNDTSNQPSINLYDNLRAAGPVYALEWQSPTSN